MKIVEKIVLVVVGIAVVSFIYGCAEGRVVSQTQNRGRIDAMDNALFENRVLDLAGKNYRHEKHPTDFGADLIAQNGKEQDGWYERDINLILKGVNDAQVVSPSKSKKVSNALFSLLREAQIASITYFRHNDINGNGIVDLGPGTNEIQRTKMMFKNDTMVAVIYIPPLVRARYFNILDVDAKEKHPDITAKTWIYPTWMVKTRDGAHLRESFFSLIPIRVNDVFSYDNNRKGTKIYRVVIGEMDERFPFMTKKFLINWDITYEEAYGQDDSIKTALWRKKLEDHHY